MQRLFQEVILPIGILRRDSMNYPHVIVDIYERTVYPVVSHVFYGKTIEEARGYMRSHMKTDSFLRAAINSRKYKGINLKVGITEVGD
jgi:hypothetical protein